MTRAEIDLKGARVPAIGRLKTFEVTRVLRKGSTFSTPHLLVRSFRPRDKAAPARLAAVVPKRLAPHAVDRNRLRRQMREAFSRLEGMPAGDHVATVRRIPEDAYTMFVNEALAWRTSYLGSSASTSGHFHPTTGGAAGHTPRGTAHFSRPVPNTVTPPSSDSGH